MADNPEGISIHEVAEKMGIHRNTAAKYLEILHSQGLVEVKKVGVTKLYSPSRRIPVSCVLHLFSEPVFGIDRGNIIRVVNTAALEMIGLSREECIGRSITLLDDLICNGISDGIIPSLRGTPCSCTLTRQTRGTRIVFAIRGIPVQLDSGRSGAAVIIKSATSPEGLIARLEYAEKMLDLFMALSDPIIVTFSESFEISFANEGFIRSCMPTGSSGKEGFLPFDMFIHDRDRFLDTLEKARETGEWSAVLRIIHSSGDIRLYQWTFHADHEGSWQYLAIGRDQTEHYYEKEQFSQFLESTEMLLEREPRTFARSTGGYFQRYLSGDRRKKPSKCMSIPSAMSGIWSSGLPVTVLSRSTIPQPGTCSTFLTRRISSGSAHFSPILLLGTGTSSIQHYASRGVLFLRPA
jgi:PAS domain-containing protein